ncbi:MAG: glycosyltransferase family 2 protein [Acidobacteria bacterium]|nr:glycosyltransferase family 2 protein [Acidobacteriota bacterium]
MRLDSVSVFFPAYNDAPSIPTLVRNAFSVLQTCTDDFEVIVVNDGSRDETGVRLAELQAELGPRLRVITHECNRGYGAALRSGFEAARKHWVFYTDGDGQYDICELPLLVRRLRPPIGLVNGYKLQRHDPWHRVCIGRLYNTFARTLFRIRLRDIDCDYRLIRRDLLEDIELRSTSGTICVELVRKLELSGCGIAEVGVHHYPRLYGRSQFFRIRSLLVTFSQLMRLYNNLVVRPTLKTYASRLYGWSLKKHDLPL